MIKTHLHTQIQSFPDGGFPSESRQEFHKGKISLTKHVHTRCPIFIIFAPVILVKQFVETHSTYLHTTVSGYFIVKLLVMSKYVFAQVASASETFLVGVVCGCITHIDDKVHRIEYNAVFNCGLSLSLLLSCH